MRDGPDSQGEHWYVAVADLQARVRSFLISLSFAELIRSLGGRFTPEIKAPDVDMPFGNFSQRDFVMKVISEYEEYHIPSNHVWLQSATLKDIEYVVSETEYGEQAVVLDFEDDRFGVRADDEAFLDKVKSTGAKYVAPPMFKLVAPEDGMIVASEFAALIKERELHIITWTLGRTEGPLEKSESTDYYWQTLQGQGLNLTAGSRFELLDVLYKEVGIEGIFDDWPAVTTFYANCMDIKLR